MKQKKQDQGEPEMQKIDGPRQLACKASPYGLSVMGLCAALVACGGGGSSKTTQTSLPTEVSIAASALVQTATEVVFKPSVDAASGLSFRWDLGDGSSAVTDAAPTHVFERPGNYRVSLTVSDTTGTTRNASFNIVVSDQVQVKGLQCSAADSAGWCWAPPMIGTGDFNHTVFVDAKLGWAAGEAGHVYKSSDAGKTWTSTLQVSNDSVVNVAAADAQRVWALTRAGLIYGSADGGATWRQLPNALVQAPPTGLSWRMEVLDAQHLQIHLGADEPIDKGEPPQELPALWSSDGGESWAVPTQTIVARHGQVFWGSASRSEDKGQTFQAYDLPALKAFERYKMLSVADEQVAVWTVEYADYSSRRKTVAMVRTTDGGRTWERREMPEDGPRLKRSKNNGGSQPREYATEILAASANKLWAVSSGRVARSVDGGRSWTWHEIPELPRYFGEFFEGRVNPAEPDSFTVVAVEGAYGDGPASLWHTVDGGVRWKRSAPDAFGPHQLPRAWRRLDSQTMLWNGQGGDLFRTDDSGSTWSLLAGQGSVPGAIRKVAFWDGQHGLALQDGYRLLATADSGRTWRVVDAEKPVDLSVNAQALQLFGTKGWMLRVGKLYFSADRGRTWLSQNDKLSSRPVAMHFLDANRGVVITVNNEVLRTADGGVTWRSLGRKDGFMVQNAELSFSNESNGVLRDGSTDLYLTRDGGATWRRSSQPRSTSIKQALLVDGLNGWAIGSDDTNYRSERLLLQTRDGGESWLPVVLPPPMRIKESSFRAISFSNASHVWIVGDGGVIYATQNGGLSWAQQVSHSTRDLTAVHFSSNTRGWIGGARGEFLITGSGGK